MKNKRKSFTSEEIEIINKERSELSEQFYNGLMAYGLSNEDAREEVAYFHEQLVRTVENKVLPKYETAQSEKYEKLKAGIIKDVSYGLFFASAAAISSLAAPVICTAALGVSAIVKAVSAMYHLVKQRKVGKEFDKVEGAWRFAQDNVRNVIDFCDCNKIDIVLEPFEPLALRELRYKKSNVEALRDPESDERFEKLLEVGKKHQMEYGTGNSESSE